MEYELVDAGPCRKTLRLKFTPHDVDTAFDESYAEINNYVQLRGFRKGKAPRRTLEKRFASEAANTTRDALSDKNVREIIEKEKLHIIGNVVTKNNLSMPVPGQEFNLEIQMDVAPTIDLPEYKGLELQTQDKGVAVEAIDQAVERYRKMLANYEPIDESARVDDVVTVDFVARVGATEIMNQQDQRLRVEGDQLFGLPCPGLVEKFTGVKAGDSVNLTVTMPADHPEPDLRDKPANIDINVKGVERGQLPELNDEFAKSLGVASLAALREHIKAGLVRDSLMETRSKQEDEIIERLTDLIKFEVPADLINEELEDVLKQRRNRLLRAGVAPANVESAIGEYRPEAEKIADRKVRWQIIATQIGEKEGIAVTNDDMQAQIEALAASYRTTPAKIIQRVKEMNGIVPMAEQILSLKVVSFIIDHAKGGRMDPNRQKDVATEMVNADAAMSVTKKPDETPTPEETPA